MFRIPHSAVLDERGLRGINVPPKHPYYKAPAEVKKKVNAIVATLVTKTGKGKKGSKPTREERKQIRENYVSFVKTLPEVMDDGNISHQKNVTTADGDIIRVGKTFFDETFSKNIRNEKLKETMDLAIDFENWMPKLSQGRIEAGIDHDYPFKAYEINHNGFDIVFKAKLTEGTIAYTMRIKKKPT